MAIQAISAMSPISTVGTRAIRSADPTGSFEQTLGKAIQGLSDVQTKSDTLAANLATGKNVSLVDTVLSMQQTSLQFNLAMQVRDRVIEAYQEVMRTQV